MNEDKLFESGCCLCGDMRMVIMLGHDFCTGKPVPGCNRENPGYKLCHSCERGGSEQGVSDADKEITRRRAALAGQQRDAGDSGPWLGFRKGERVRHSVRVEFPTLFATADGSVVGPGEHPSCVSVHYDGDDEPSDYEPKYLTRLSGLTPATPVESAKVEPKRDPSRLCANRRCQNTFDHPDPEVTTCSADCEAMAFKDRWAKPAPYVPATGIPYIGNGDQRGGLEPKTLDTRIAQALEQLSRPLPSAHPPAWPSDCDSEELYVST